ncbi:hypothetical protein Dsin_023565 [Dipteronia sinensis]|uniref:WW domain-containing protein n=1 Tax=Dipteronia sinensis TaxID=43782 RepID=A0AAE0A460_9ROSI|nr:hypothetical protein Dsin_023565 [Dipteronia sinensis]
MGRRKDRILAAMSNAGRRVKLDLSAEPSGDLGGSSVHDEVGKDMESKERAGLPNSPSSSGQQQNPLLLLGQYSDDEIDEESNDKLKHTGLENSSADDNNQGTFGEGSEDKDVNTGQDLAAQDIKQQDEDVTITSPDGLQKPEVRDAIENDATSSDHLHEGMNLTELTSVDETSTVQVFGDASSGWKMVLHEESNRYYYWNIETGETSWEVPQVLAQTTELCSDQKATVSESTQTAVVVAPHESDSTMAVEMDYYSTAQTIDDSMGVISQSKAAYECGPQMEEKVEGSKIEDQENENGHTDVSQTELSNTGGAVVASLGDGSEMYIDGSLINEESKTPFDLPSELVKRSEHLLEKLKSLEAYGASAINLIFPAFRHSGNLFNGYIFFSNVLYICLRSKGHLQGHDWTAKYVSEVEIRLSDIKSLLSYGSSLLPFWLHSERQLKQLEGAIDKEIYQIAKSQVDEVMATHMSSCIEEEKSPELGQEPQGDESQNNAILSASIISNVPSTTDTPMVVPNDLHNEASALAVQAENLASDESPTEHLESGSIVGEQVNGASFPESISKPVFHDEEDVDMDVDMDVDVEVEDAIPAGDTSIGDASGANVFAPQEHLCQPNPPAEYSSLPPEDPLFVPPPPGEEWIPPPPPDNEQVPPPPPDEPPEPSYASTAPYIESGQPLPYTEQYNISYPNSGFTYYGHTIAEVPSSNFYVHADGSQVDVPHASIYYGAVPNMYNGTAPVMVNHIESLAYYGHQDGTIPSVPGVENVESSQNYTESGLASESNHASGRIGSVDALPEAGATLKADVSAVGGETDMGSQAVPSTSETAEAPASTSVKESVSTLSSTAIASAAAIATTSSTAKAQSKVRNKKRTIAVAPSLRSNKKVSSMVDKWKAAKEEMNENEEDEPENAYDFLEKKRQREIEQWRAQQIASGEAKDNANFQPLGGDWREKVKRRRAQAAKEAAKKPPEETKTEKKTDTKKQPNLVDLARNLPSGWQAYYDETSKQVYYGNIITSETTWTRPT